MPRYFSEIAFNGSAYHGWQVQPNAVTVQEKINDCFQKLIGDKSINVMGCGRTDTGVHAKQFFLHFDTNKALDSNIVNRANGFLPEDIFIKSLKAVPEDLHARFSAVSRTYEYFISRSKDPFGIGRSWLTNQEIDVDKLNNQLKEILGEHDFTSFSKSNTQVHTNTCFVSKAKWEEIDNGYLFTISANRFLRNMVRAVVGTCVEISKDPSHQGIKSVLDAKSRSAAGVSVPAQGLYLVEVKYPSEEHE